MVRSEPKYVRRRRVALLVVLAVLLLLVLGVSRVVAPSPMEAPQRPR